MQPTNPAAQSTTRRWQRAAAFGLAMLLQTTSAVQAADLSQQMANMFGSGALSNATGPGVYQSQTQNIYVGGEMQLRLPTRSYQFYSFSLPKVTAGCGGVDLYMGSFSHISEDKFKQMLESVAQSYKALLFKAALKSINPLIESVVGDLQKSLESFSQYANNSCAMAEWLMEQTSAATGMTSQTNCVKLAMSPPFNDDLSAAQARCKTPGGVSSTNAQAKASGVAETVEMADRDINLIWEALSKSTFSKDEKEVFMNMAGTVIVYKPANNGDKPKMPLPLEPGIDSLITLVTGHQQSTTSADEVVIKNWISCPYPDCLAPALVDKVVTPFPVLTRKMLEKIRDRVVNRQALQPDEIKFVNMTSVPIYRMLAIGYTKTSVSGGTGLIDQLIDRYSKVIAYEYAYGFMKTGLRDARLYLSMSSVQNKVEEKLRDRLIDRVNGLMDEVDKEHTKALLRVRDARAVIEDMQAIERDMRKSLPTTIRNMQNLTALMRGG
jgi:conjugative transfer pilus assembly protein TraH